MLMKITFQIVKNLLAVYHRYETCFACKFNQRALFSANVSNAFDFFIFSSFYVNSRLAFESPRVLLHNLSFVIDWTDRILQNWDASLSFCWTSVPTTHYKTEHHRLVGNIFSKFHLEYGQPTNDEPPKYKIGLTKSEDLPFAIAVWLK